MRYGERVRKKSERGRVRELRILVGYIIQGDRVFMYLNRLGIPFPFPLISAPHGLGSHFRPGPVTLQYSSFPIS